MFGTIFADELRRRLRSLTPWLLILLLVGYTASALLGADTPELGGGGVPHNGSFVINYWCMYSAFWVAVLGPMLIAAPLLRDIRTGMAPLVYATPIGDSAYFWGKYAAGMAITVLVLMSVPATILVLPLIARAADGGGMFLEQTLWGHLGWATLVWVLPACLVYGSIHFALAARTGRLLLCYGFAVLSMAVFTMFFVSFKTSDTDHALVELIDPMGKQTLDAQALLWSVSERVSHSLAPAAVLVGNRLLWLMVGGVFLAWGATGFRLERLMARARPSPRARRSRPVRRMPAIGGRSGLLFHLAGMHVRITLRSAVFQGILLALVVIGMTSAWGADAGYTIAENQMLPYAQYLFTVVQPSLYIMLAMTVIYFAGELAARDRDSRMIGLIAVTETPDALLVSGRWLVIILLALLLSVIPSVSIALFQLLKGFVEPEPQHFLRSILLHLFPPLLSFGTLALAIELLTRNRLAAQGVPMLLLWGGIALHESGVVTERLALFGTPQPMIFSVFAVLGPDTARHLLYAGWWFGLVTALLMGAMWLDRRAEPAPFLARARAVRPQAGEVAVLGGLLLLSLGSAIAIHHELHGINDSRTPAEERDEQADYERRYRAWATAPRPLVLAEAIHVALDPLRGKIEVHGDWTIRNPSARPINAILVNVPTGASLSLGTPLALLGDDAQLNVQTYRLDRPLAPGEQRNIRFALVNNWRGFIDEAYAWRAGRDVMVLDRTALPRLNYDRALELASVAERRNRGLPPRQPPLREPERSALNDSAGRVTFDIEVTTQAGFEIFASATRTAESVREGRRTTCFHATQAPLDALVVTARGLVTEDVLWRSPSGQDVVIRFAHRPEHGRNSVQMADDVRAVLNSLSHRFGTPPFSTLDVVEEPQFLHDETPIEARASGSLVMIPERRGWLHDTARQAGRDYLLFVLGREIGRVWWRARTLAPTGPGAAAIDDGVPIALGLDAIATQDSPMAAKAFAIVLQEQLRRDIARSDMAPATTATASTDQPYAGLQAGLALFDRWYGEKKPN